MFPLQVLIAYIQYVYNRRVCIVGGAKEIAIPPDAEIVVWANTHWLDRQDLPIQVAYVNGIRRLTLEDILPLETFRNQIKFVFVAGTGYGCEKWLGLCRELNIPSMPYGEVVGIQAVARWHRLLRVNVPQPTTGMDAIWHLLSLPIKTLYLTGMNLYTDTPTYDKKIGHNMTLHAEFLNRLVEFDDRIVMEKELRSAIYQLIYPTPPQ